MHLVAEYHVSENVAVAPPICLCCSLHRADPPVEAEDTTVIDDETFTEDEISQTEQNIREYSYP